MYVAWAIGLCVVVVLHMAGWAPFSVAFAAVLVTVFARDMVFMRLRGARRRQGHCAAATPSTSESDERDRELRRLWPLRYNVRQLLGAVTLLAAVLAVLHWFRDAPYLSAASAEIVIDGSAIHATWTNASWNSGRSSFERAEWAWDAPVDASPDAMTIAVDQDLFRVTCRDHFGNRMFSAEFELYGTRNADWTHYALFPCVSCSGDRDGACYVALNFDSRIRVLRVRVQQTFRRRHATRETELVYVLDGKKFRLRDNAKPRGRTDAMMPRQQPS